jgi:glucokinase
MTTPNLLIGIDLGGTSIKAGLVDHEGRILASDSSATGADRGPAEVLDRMARLAEALVQKAGVKKDEVLALGVGSPGPLNSRTGVVLWTPNLPGWKDVPVADELAKRTGLKCFLEGDAWAAAWGELWLGAARGADSMIMLTLGTGVGGAIILGRELLKGPDESGGHLGHVTVDWDGRLFPTGNRGALEAYASATAIVRRYQEEDLRREFDKTGKLPGPVRCDSCGSADMTPEWTRAGLELVCMECAARQPAPMETWGRPTTAADIAKRAEAGCETCRGIYRETGVILGAFLAGMANALNPEVAVIGGGVAAAGELLFEPMRSAARARAFPGSGGRMKIVPAQLGNDAGFLGAAGLAMKRAGECTR